MTSSFPAMPTATRLMQNIFLTILFFSIVSATSASPSTPNIVVIFIDDMGYGDVEFNGGVGPRTPNLNQMAAEGMKFTDFYVGCAVCSGSRAALLTGTHYQRLGIPGVLFPDGQRGLHPDEHTIADMLKDAGYATACVGKWHLGHLPPCLPTYQGFETYFGIPYSNDMWIDPANRLSSDIVLREGVTMSDLKSGQTIKESVPLMRDEEIVEYPCNQSTITKRYTEESIRFIKNHLESPFFLYLPHTMVHRPLAVSDSFADRTGSLLFDAIEEVDWSVGEILRTLRSEGIADRTLVIFTSDNGAALGSSAPLRAKKFSVYDGGIREPTLMWWPGQIPAGSVCREIAASIDILPTLSKLCQGRLSDHPVDGRDIWPLMSDPNATSPHDAFVLSHGPGTVRRGKWKFYPWREKATGRDAPVGRDPSPEPVQLYDLSTDIGETTNLAALHPEVCRNLQARFDEHVADIKSSEREAASLKRPSDAPPPTRPKRRS